ncbi:integrase, catalytic region, zinc finger, CCHC-type containing protein [Tanacetum coccineum]
MDSIITLGQKNTLAEYMILFGADNRPPMLDKDLYDSWKSRMELYMQNREHGRMILESVEHGPLIWPTVEENGVIRTKKYAELSAAEKIQVDCDIKATNIILQGLLADIYSLVNHHRVAKDLWEIVQLLMQGTSLTKQERECKLYDAFDKFTHIKGESLHTYYLRFTQLINDMNIYKMKMEQFQVNTKFLNSLPPEWSKFVTDVKLVKDLHTSNFDQLHAYLEQHELHANEVRIMRERNQDPLAFVANQQMTPPHFNTYQYSYNNPQLQPQFSPSQYGSIQPNQHYSSHYPSQTQFNHSSIPPSHTFQSQMNHQTSYVPQVTYQSPPAPTQLMTESPFVDSGFDVPVFSPGDDPIACLNKAMAFLTAVASSRFPSTNNQLRTSSNPRNQATIQDGRVTVQQVQGRQGQNYSGTTYKGNATSSRGNTTSGQAKVVKCYNCQGEGHMARQCTQPKRPRNAAWYKEKAMLAEAQEAGQILDEEQLAFLADPGIPAGQAQTIIPHNAAYGFEIAVSDVREEIRSLRQRLVRQTREINGNDGDNGNDSNGDGENGNGEMEMVEMEIQTRLKRCLSKMETVFHISNFPKKSQVKYATCTLLNSALTWWNSHKRTIGTKATFDMSWRELMKLMTKVYCPRNEIQKMESELWNLTVKNNNLAAYTQRFQELTMMCTKMVLEEEDRVEKFFGGLPDNIQRNLKGYAMKNAENKRRLEVNQRDNRGQQPPFKRPNVGGQNVARAYTAGNNEKKPYNGLRLSVISVTISTTSTQRGQVVNQRVVTCFECGRQGYYRGDCPKSKDQNRGNKAGNKNGVGEARGKAYVLGGGDTNPNSNVVKGTFLLNNHYAFILFDSGADRSFVSTTFSTLLDITPDTLDISYDAN